MNREIIEDMLVEMRGILYRIEDILKRECNTTTDFRTPLRVSRISRKHVTWIMEKEAAVIMGMSARSFRAAVKSGQLDIAFSAPNGWSFRYCKEHIQRVILENSNLMDR